MTKICHLSSAHNGLDIRIFRKECISLARAGYETHLVINATDADVEEGRRHGVIVHRLHYVPEARRFSRMGLHAWRCYQAAKRIDADLYHLHDPELIPYAMAFANAGKKVIYDAHEDLPSSVLSKEWIPASARTTVSRVSRAVEHFSVSCMSGVIAATPFIGKQFEGKAKCVTVVNNYPSLDEVPRLRFPDGPRDSVCYVGGIEIIRGIRQIVAAIASTESTLLLAGRFASEELRAEIVSHAGWNRVRDFGFVERQQVWDIMSRSFAGLVTFNEVPNFIRGQPIKMFEYMAAGVPVIASHFPLWREIVEGNECGICIDPENPDEISAAIRRLQKNPAEVTRMGRNGREAVEKKYHWDSEEVKLVSTYRSILGKEVEDGHFAHARRQRNTAEL